MAFCLDERLQRVITDDRVQPALLFQLLELPHGGRESALSGRHSLEPAVNAYAVVQSGGVPAPCAVRCGRRGISADPKDGPQDPGRHQPESVAEGGQQRADNCHREKTDQESRHGRPPLLRSDHSMSVAASPRKPLHERQGERCPDKHVYHFTTRRREPQKTAVAHRMTPRTARRAHAKSLPRAAHNSAYRIDSNRQIAYPGRQLPVNRRSNVRGLPRRNAKRRIYAMMENLIALIALTAMEIVLGIDNIVFIVILTGRLPKDQQKLGRRVGLLAAMGMRILLLMFLSAILGLTKDVFALTDLGIPAAWFGGDEEIIGVSVRDLILLVGGLFLIGKSVFEIHERLEDHARETKSVEHPSFTSVVIQIMILDIVFSLDSVITAVGMAEHLWVMIVAVMLAVGVMMMFSESDQRIH